MNTSTENTSNKKYLYGGSLVYYGDEISDKDYSLKYNMAEIYRSYKTGVKVLLGSLINHKYLFEKYPLAKTILVEFGNIEDETDFANSEVEHSSVAYSSSGIKINLHFNYYEKYGNEKYQLSGEYPEYSKESTILHEVQHICQQADGRDYGYGSTYIHNRLIPPGQDGGRSDSGGEEVEELVTEIYKSQPSEQESMITVYKWLKSKGLKYKNDKYIDFSFKQSESQSQAQEGLYEKGGPIKVPIKQGKFELPKGHHPFLKVPKGGSSCANCKFLSKDKKHCENSLFVKWYGQSKLPQPVSRFCSDWYEPAPEYLAKGGKVTPNKTGKAVQPINPERWEKKRQHIEQMANSIRGLRGTVTRDLKGDDEKRRLTALVVAIIDKTSERVGNEGSEDAGHLGVTGFKKRNVTIIGNKVHLKYTGKSGVLHEKSFSDALIAKTLKRTIKDSPKKRVFVTKNGLSIRASQVNRYLAEYDITAKDLRGFNANRFIIEKLNKVEVPDEVKHRKVLFRKALRHSAERVGHKPMTLQKHYLMPELQTEYVSNGKILDLSQFHSGGDINDGRSGGLLVGETDKDGGEGIVAATPDRSVILGGGEKIIVEDAHDQVHTFDGKKKTSIEIQSALNVEAGGVPIPTDVDGNTTKMENGGEVPFASPEVMKIIAKAHSNITRFKREYAPNVHEIRAEIDRMIERGEIPNPDVKLQEGGEIENTPTPEEVAQKMVDELSEEQLSSIKEAFDKIKNDVILEEQVSLEALVSQKQELIAEKKRQDELKNYDAKFKIADEVSELNKKIRNKTNAISAIKNGGDWISFTDKKDVEHKDVPNFSKIKTDFISFDEETILTDALPEYIPLIDEEIFARKGYIFDAIRLGKDTYILATNGYNEFKSLSRQEEFSGGKRLAEDYEQGYVIVTLDQLALISDYYYKKAKATIEKRAQENDKDQEERYDRLPIERRQAFLNQKYFYRSLPAAVKKKITEPDYEALSLSEKEVLYKPFARSVRRRLVSKLADNEIYTSFHNMYERFLNPLAVPPKPRYGNSEVFEYWRKFRYMMDWKIKDIKVQRQFESDIRATALETSFGDSNTDTELKEKYGILVKRQNGEKIQPNEIEQIRKAWEAVNKTFGNLTGIAKDNNLKISHTGKTLVFASKAVGVYVPKMKTIAVSAKLGNDQFENIMAHEVAHLVDNLLGGTTGHRYASDDFESKAGMIGDTMRRNMNVKTDSDYYNSTKECFARSMEQYFAIETFGEDAAVIFSYNELDKIRPYFLEDHYVPKEIYENKLRPLIKEFLEENKEFFKYDVIPEKELTLPNELKQETMEHPLIDMSAKDTLSVALQDVISLPKYSKLDLADAKILYSLDGKTIESDNIDSPETLKDEVHKSLYDIGYIEYEGDWKYILSESAKDFINAVNIRIATIEGVKSGTDLFPQEANIEIHQPERIYKDMKSCILSEGDNDAGYIFEGKKLTNLESAREGVWEIVEFFKYGIVITHIVKNKLTDKKQDKRLTFKELKKIYGDGDITIEGVDSPEKLDHCLKVLTKCIDLIDINEALEAEKKGHTVAKEKVVKGEKVLSAQKIADKLIAINGKVWDKLKIQSGSQLYDDKDLQIKYKESMDSALEGKFTYPLSQEVADILENENEHSLNQYLDMSGAYGEESKQKWFRYLDNLAPNKGGLFLSSAPYRPEMEVIPEAMPTHKEIQDAIYGLEIILEDAKGKEKQELKDTIEGLKVLLEDAPKMQTGGRLTDAEEKAIQSLVGKAVYIPSSMRGHNTIIKVRYVADDNVKVETQEIGLNSTSTGSYTLKELLDLSKGKEIRDGMHLLGNSKKEKMGDGGKIENVMREFKQGKLRTSSGKKVKDRKQAIAIGLSEARAAGENVPELVN